MVAELSGGFDGFVSNCDSMTCCRESSGSDTYRPSTGPRPAIPGDKEKAPKLLDRLKEALRARHYSPRTESTYCEWVKRYIFFTKSGIPAEMAEPEINAFLTHLAVKHKVSASTQTQALSALLFLYRQVLGREIGALGEIIRAKKAKRLPVVMTREEVREVLNCLAQDKKLMAGLLYGAGLRLMECLQCGCRTSTLAVAKS